MDDGDDLVTDQQTNIDACSRQVKKLSKSKKKSHKISLAALNDLSTVAEDNDADKLLEENNKLREQNLKLQKILAKAGVKFDNDNYACESVTQQLQQSSSITYTSASTTFISDIQDVKVSGGSCSFNSNNNRNASSSNNNDDDYNSSSNNNVECSTDAVVKNKNGKRRDDDHFAGSSTEVLLCDTSTNIDCSTAQEDNNNSHTENDMFSELQVDTTVDLGCKSSDDVCLTISLPTQSCSTDQKSTNSFNIKTSSNYLNSDSIVDISPPLPSTDQNHFSSPSAFTSNPPSSSLVNNNHMFAVNNSLNSSYNTFGQPWTNLPSLAGSNQPAMLNLQRFDGPGASQLNLMNNFNNGIFINQLGQPISFLPPPPPPQPPSLILNTNTGLLTPQGKILSPASNNIVTPQGNVLLQNCPGLGQPFNSSANTLNYIPQATPLFNGNQVKAAHMPGQMTLNVLPQNSQSRDFLMLPNGKLVPISTQPSILPANPTNPAMQSIITGFSNHVRLQGSQLIGATNMPRNSQPFGFLPNQFSILGSPINPGDISRLANPNQFAVNGLPLVASGQMPPTLQVLNHLPQFSPQTNLSSTLNSQPTTLLQPQNFVMQNNQPCMMAYITPEGTIVLSLQQQGNKKATDDMQKAGQLLNNNLSQEKKTQRRIMPKPPSNDGLNLGSIIPKCTSMNCNLISASTSSSSSSSNANNTAEDHDKISQPYFASNQLIQNSHDAPKKSLSVSTNAEPNNLELMNNHEEYNAKKKANLKKRDFNNAEKKKRMKTNSKSEPINLETNSLNSTSLAQAPDVSELQDISCCILNDQIHEQFVQTLNDDDQGDINQFSDLIVMDNEVTSNPTTTNTKESLAKSDGLDMKDNLTVELSCDSLMNNNNHSLLIVSSTTSCHSENVIVSSGGTSDGTNAVNDINTNSNNTINGVNIDICQNNFIGSEKKKKKKVKHVNQGLLTVEPVISLPSLLCPKLTALDGMAENVYSNFFNDNDTLMDESSILNGSTDNNNIISGNNNHHHSKKKDNLNNSIITNEMSVNLINKKEISAVAFDTEVGFHLKDNLMQTEASSSTSQMTTKHSQSDDFAPDASALESKPLDGVFPDRPTFNASQPDKVEEGTQTMRHERKKKKKKNKKDKLGSGDNMDDSSTNNTDNNISNDDVPPILTREPSVVDNIPDKFSFSEDQLMDVVEKVENLVAQSVSLSTSACVSSSSSSSNCTNVNNTDKIFNNDLSNLPTNKTHFSGMPPKLELSSLRVECQNKRKHQEVDVDSKANKKVKHQHENIISENRSNKSFSHSNDEDKNLNGQSDENMINSLQKTELDQMPKDLPASSANSITTSQSIQRKTSTSESKKNVYITDQDISQNRKVSVKESMKISRTEEIPKSSARHIAIVSLARTNNKTLVPKTAPNKITLKTCENATDSSTKQLSTNMKDHADHVSQDKNNTLMMLDNTKGNKNDRDDGLNQVVIKNEPKSIVSSSACSDPVIVNSGMIASENNDIANRTNSSNDNDKDNLKNKRDDKSNLINLPNIQSTSCSHADEIQETSSNIANSQTKFPVESSHDQNTKKKDNNLSQPQSSASSIRTKSTYSTNDELNDPSILPEKSDKHPCSRESNSSSNSPDKHHSANNNIQGLKSETNAADCSSEKKMDTSISNASQQILSKENISVTNVSNNQQKAKTKTDPQIPKSTKYQPADNDATIISSSNTSINNNMNNNNNHFYPMDDASKKFSYPNIFAPPLFSDPYSSSCAQFSTFPVNGGTTFDTGFMLPPCLPFDAPVANASFNYYGGDTSRYSHFGHSSLPSKNPCHSFSSMPSDYPSCSMEPKKVSSNGNFVNNTNRMNKDDSFKNKIDLFRKDPFMAGDFQFDAQFMFPNGDKSNMAYCMDNTNYGLPFSSSTFLNGNINNKGYSSTKLENQVSGKSNKTFNSPPASSSSLLTYNRTSSNTLASPPLHHHPLLFDQKNASFSSSFDLPFNSSSLNSFMENCNMIDQSIMSPANGTFSHNGMKDYNMMKDALYEDKKTTSRSNNTHKSSYNVPLPNNSKQTSSITPSMPNVMVISSSTPTNQTKTTTKSSKSSKKTTVTTQSKTNADSNNNNNNNACMFNQHITPMKTSCNNDVLSNIASNFNSGLFCRTTTAAHPDNKYHNQYASTAATSAAMNNSSMINNNNNNPNLRTCSNLGMDYVSSQILGPSGPHHHPHFGFNHLFPEMDIPNGYLKFSNPSMSDVETMPLHHHHGHKNLHQSPGSNQTVLSDFNPFFHPSQYAFDGSSSYLNQSNCSTGPFSMGTFNIRMPRMHHQNNNSF